MKRGDFKMLVRNLRKQQETEIKLPVNFTGMTPPPFFEDKGYYTCLGCMDSPELSDRLNPKITLVFSTRREHDHRTCEFCEDRFTVLNNGDGSGLRVSRGWV